MPSEGSSESGAATPPDEPEISPWIQENVQHGDGVLYGNDRLKDPRRSIKDQKPEMCRKASKQVQDFWKEARDATKTPNSPHKRLSGADLLAIHNAAGVSHTEEEIKTILSSAGDSPVRKSKPSRGITAQLDKLAEDDLQFEDTVRKLQFKDAADLAQEIEFTSDEPPMLNFEIAREQDKRSSLAKMHETAGRNLGSMRQESKLGHANTMPNLESPTSPKRPSTVPHKMSKSKRLFLLNDAAHQQIFQSRSPKSKLQSSKLQKSSSEFAHADLQALVKSNDPKIASLSPRGALVDSFSKSKRVSEFSRHNLKMHGEHQLGNSSGLGDASWPVAHLKGNLKGFVVARNPQSLDMSSIKSSRRDTGLKKKFILRQGKNTAAKANKNATEVVMNSKANANLQKVSGGARIDRVKIDGVVDKQGKRLVLVDNRSVDDDADSKSVD